MNKNNWILGFFIIIGICLIIYLSKHFQLQSDMSFFISESSTSQQEVKLVGDFFRNSDANRFLFVRLSANNTHPATTEKLAKLSKKMKKELLLSTEKFSAVENGEFDNRLILDGLFYPYRYLIAPEIKASFFSNESLEKKFNDLEKKISFILTPQELKYLSEDPLNVWLSYLSNFKNIDLNKRNGVWFNDKNEALILLKTKADGFDLLKQQQNLELIENLFNSFKQIAEYKDIKINISGAAIIALDTKDKITTQLTVLSTIASLVLFVFIYSIFQSFRLLIITLIPLAFAILVGMSVVNFIYGYVHGIALAFGITIIGVAVDYPLHFFSHLFFSKTENNKNIQEHKLALIVRIWPKIKLGLLTTIIGFMSIIMSSFTGLNQLGLFAVSGLISSALLTRYLLPILPYKTMVAEKVKKREKMIAFLERSLSFNYKKKAQLVSYGLFVLSFIIILSTDKLWENNLALLSPVSTIDKKEDFTLRKSFSLPEINYLFLINANSYQDILLCSEELDIFLNEMRKEKIITHFDSISKYLASKKTQMQRQHLIPDSIEFEQKLSLILKNTPFNINSFQPFMDSLSNSKELKLLQFNDLTDSLISQKVRSLIYKDESSNTNLNQQSLYSFILLSGVKGQELAEKFNHFKVLNSDLSHLGKVTFIDINAQSSQLVKSYRQEALQWFFIGVLLMSVFLLIYSKKLKLLYHLLLPFSGAIILTTASLLIMGYSLSIFHLVSLLLVLGLGIDYSVFMNEFNELKQKSLPSKKVIKVNLFSVLVCACSSMIMFFGLAFSSIPVLNAIGLTSVLGIFYAFILTIIFSNLRQSNQQTNI